MRFESSLKLTDSSQSFASLLNSLGGATATPTASAGTLNTTQPKPGSQTNAVHGVPAQVNSTSATAALKRKREEVSKQTTGQGQSRNEAATVPNATPGSQHRERLPVASSTLTPGSQPTASTAILEKPPPKGSYREIMMRAQMAKDSSYSFGQIKHKPVERPVKKDRVDSTSKAASNSKATGYRVVAQPRAGTVTAHRSTPSPRKHVPNILGKPKRKPLDLGYRGTMRPSSVEPQPKPNGRPRSTGAQITHSAQIGAKISTKQAQDRHTGRQYRYGSESEEFEEEDELDDDDSDDRGGGGFDELMAEEEESLRAARREDEEARREENEHRRQKAEKKKALERLAAARRGRG